MTRYATIITGDDGREIVSAIGEFEGAAPLPRLGRAEPVAPGVSVGMVRDAAGGFAFPQANVAGQLVGLAMARLKARAGVAKPARAARPDEANKPDRAARPKGAKRAKKRTRKKSARSKKPVGQVGSAKAGMAVSTIDANAMGQVHD